MSDFVTFGDTDGTLGDRVRAGDQDLTSPLPPGLANYNLVRITGDALVLTDRAEGGDDSIRTGFGANNLLVGDARRMEERSLGGDDTIGSSAGFNNSLFGDAEEMMDRARGGDDVLDAPSPAATRTAATSFLYGDAGLLMGRAQGGDDTLSGAVGFEGSTARLYGDGFALLDESQGGNDRLVSRSTRNDEMWGDAYSVAEGAGTGRDTFVFGVSVGRDQINDFRQGEDLIDLTAFSGSGIGSFQALAPRIIEQADGTLITLDIDGGVGNSVFVAGVTGLGAADFLLG
jgi:hypothetical protein